MNLRKLKIKSDIGKSHDEQEKLKKNLGNI